MVRSSRSLVGFLGMIVGALALTAQVSKALVPLPGFTPHIYAPPGETPPSCKEEIGIQTFENIKLEWQKTAPQFPRGTKSLTTQDQEIQVFLCSKPDADFDDCKLVGTTPLARRVSRDKNLRITSIQEGGDIVKIAHESFQCAKNLYLGFQLAEHRFLVSDRMLAYPTFVPLKSLRTSQPLRFEVGGVATLELSYCEFRDAGCAK